MSEPNGPRLDTDVFPCMPQLSDWPVYDAIKDVFALLDVAANDSFLDLTRSEEKALSILNL